MKKTQIGWLAEWPSPRTPLRIGDAARVIGKSKKTLERARDAIRNGEVGKGVTTDEQVLKVAGLYAPLGKGAVVLAAEIYTALGYTEEKLRTFNLPEPKPKASGKPKKKAVWEMTAEELSEALRKDAERFDGPLGGPVPYTRMRAAYRELRDGYRIEIQGTIKNIPFAKALGFKSLADFLRKGSETDCYPFVIPLDHGRPIDLLSSKKKHRRLGDIVFLTIEEWQKMMAKVMAAERGLEEGTRVADELDVETAQGKPSPERKRKGTLR
ncbi:MAG: hypothetical protein WCL27_09050 [Betaproteobacteria bacterium]